MGKHVTIKINDKTVVDYTEPENPEHIKERPGTYNFQRNICIAGS